jgi:uncharacterized lipoprotein YmbA
MLNNLSKWFVISTTGALLSACIASSPTQFYVLEPLSEPSPPSGVSSTQRSIGIGPISIPALLERKQIITRLPDNSVTIAEFHQWAAPLKDSVTQVISQNLSALQVGDQIRAYPWTAYGAVDYRIIIDLIRFDTRPEKTVTLEATWVIMNEKTHTMINHGHTKIEHPLTDPSYPSAVKALSKALSEFSVELSLALEK